ncbi:hypothetical protein BGX34_011032 [Mortierella sp. NVP85]|nr:hypothetical protein BGX34_011032 [Mortierella sp. NVP85]
MDFITYQFDSAEQFYAELNDLLQEGGFHESPESQVNLFISLIVQYQDEFMDSSMQDLTRCCYRLFDSDLFQTNMLSISDAIIDRAIQSQSEEDMWISYHVLYYAGKEFPKIYEWMLKSEFFAKLKYQIMQTEGTRLQALAVSTMFEMCRAQPLNARDLALADEDFLHYLLDLVERTRKDADEELNYGTIQLILAFNEQYMVQQQTARAVSNYTPSNLLLSALADRPGASSTFGENLIFMLNRSEEASLQTLILKLLYLFFTSHRTQLNEFFYTNDLHVLMDVMIRELWDLPEEQEQLRHMYLRVLGPLLTRTQLRREHTTYKRAEILRVLGQLGGSDLNEELKQYIWEQEQLEHGQEMNRLHSEGRRLTYRDRQSSNPARYQLPSPLSSTSSFSSNSSTASPRLASRTSAVDDSTPSDRRPSLSVGSNSNGSNGNGHDTDSEFARSRSNSSTNLHGYLSTPPMRPVSQSNQTTQRLVERVLRDWLVADLGQNQTVSGDQRIHVQLAQ